MAAGLVDADFLPFDPRYAAAGRPGAATVARLAGCVIGPLREAERRVREDSGGRWGILLLDAHRTRATQRSLFDEHVAALALEHPTRPRAELVERARTFVAHPDGVFPHGTGGAVDATLHEGGDELDLGCAFDDFSERARVDFFVLHPPAPADAAGSAAAGHRALLQRAFRAAGFAPLAEEWWHFEHGTARWARLHGEKPVLTRVLGGAAADPSPAGASGPPTG